MELWLTTRDLEGFIGRKENLDTLEDCLAATGEQFLALRARKKDLNFGERINSK